MHGEPTDGAERRDLRKEDRAHVIDQHEYASRKFQGVSAENARIAVVFVCHILHFIAAGAGCQTIAGRARREPRRRRAVRPKFCGRLDNALRALYNMRTDESDVVRYGVAPCGERRDETAFRSVPEKIR